MLLRFNRPSYYLGIIVTAWGLVMTFSGFVKNMAGLAACRALLGLFEYEPTPTDRILRSIANLQGL